MPIIVTRRRKGESHSERIECATIGESKQAAFGFKRASISCDACQLISINGVACHETGCPQAWRDDRRACKECGSAFVPASRYQDCCDDACSRAYRGFALDDGADTDDA